MNWISTTMIRFRDAQLLNDIIIIIITIIIIVINVRLHIGMLYGCEYISVEMITSAAMNNQ